MVGCDNVLGSGMKADVCGVCNGRNNTATLVTDSVSQVAPAFGNDHHLFNISI